MVPSSERRGVFESRILLATTGRSLRPRVPRQQRELLRVRLHLVQHWGDDTYGLLQEAFGDSVPYLLVEEYFPVYWWWTACEVGWWGGDYGLGDVTAYRFDEDCHSDRDGTGATRLCWVTS